MFYVIPMMLFVKYRKVKGMCDAMLKLLIHYRGDKVYRSMWLYRPEFIADLAKNEMERYVIPNWMEYVCL